MKNKLGNLFKKREIFVQNTGVKYSELIEKLLNPFVKELDKFEFHEDILEFGINAWNIANIKVLLPDQNTDSYFNSFQYDSVDIDLLNRMVDYKISHFKEYTNFIIDYEIKETDNDTILKVTTQEQDSYLQTVYETLEEEDKSNFDENFINRSAIVIKPLHPFIDLCLKFNPEDQQDIEQTKTYLISEKIVDIDEWLKKKFDKIFTFELDLWIDNKKRVATKTKF
ncbi:MAG TPA: hypothetical protein DDZ41_02335 [Flavobacterium sp.]|nr:hypothetical protein [Flavobacterium sp.]